MVSKDFKREHISPFQLILDLISHILLLLHLYQLIVQQYTTQHLPTASLPPTINMKLTVALLVSVATTVFALPAVAEDGLPTSDAYGGKVASIFTLTAYEGRECQGQPVEIPVSFPLYTILKQ